MFGNPVLFSRFGVEWKLATVGGIAGGLLLLIGGLLFVILFKHAGAQVRPMDSAEAGRAALYGAFSNYDSNAVIKARGVGVAAELSVNIDSLRNAARRGDWLTFWLWPLILSCWVLGIWAGVMSAMEALAMARVAFIIGSVVIAPLLFVFWFMPWAAIYTNIDLGADDAGAAVKTESGTDAPPR